MKLNLYQIDAFTDKLFGGNPAAVVPLKKWLKEETMQQLAMENNLSETVFFVPSEKAGADYEIRWFTPEVEINLCGHATMASAWVIFEILKKKKKKQTVTFSSKSGLLTVSKVDERLEMDFPSWKPEKLESWPEALPQSLGHPKIINVSRYRDFLVELEDEHAVNMCRPDFTVMRGAGEKVIITAKGKKYDFVSRFFAPTAGVDEDPVTGSAHSQLIPYWSEKLNKQKMIAKQLSKRGGIVYCEQKGNRVMIGGNCAFYMQGQFKI
jgi:PhzF family phenazine biosynthesis protein